MAGLKSLIILIKAKLQIWAINYLQMHVSNLILGFKLIYDWTTMEGVLQLVQATQPIVAMSHYLLNRSKDYIGMILQIIFNFCIFATSQRTPLALRLPILTYYLQTNKSFQSFPLWQQIVTQPLTACTGPLMAQTWKLNSAVLFHKLALNSNFKYQKLTSQIGKDSGTVELITSSGALWLESKKPRLHKWTNLISRSFIAIIVEQRQ